MIEGDKIKIISGKYNGKYGKIRIKTSNGWYHVKTKESKDLVKLRLGDVVPYNRKPGLTSGQIDGIKKDYIFNKKVQNAKTRSSQRREDIKIVSRLVSSGSDAKSFDSAVRKARRNKILPEDNKLIRLGEAKKRKQENYRPYMNKKTC